LEEAPRAWRECLDRASRSKGHAHLRKVDELQGGVVTTESTVEFVIDRPNALIITKVSRSKSNESTAEAMNTDYQFKIRHAGDQWLLSDLGWDPEPELYPSTPDRQDLGKRTAFVRALKYPCRGLIIWNTWIPFMVGSKGFTIINVEKVDESGKVLRVYFELTTNDSNVPIRDGTIEFDTKRSWAPLIVSANAEWQGGMEKGTIEVKNEYRSGTDSIPSINRQITTVLATMSGKKTSDYQLIWETETDLKRMEAQDPAMFRLSAYGLPEPVRVSENRNSTFLLINILVIVCLCLAVLFRWWSQ